VITDDIFLKIESHEFSARLGLASSLNLFLSILRSESSYKELLEHIAKQKWILEALLKRIKLLSAIEHDPEYQNPHDTSMAAYLWALHDVGSAYVRIAADILVSTRDVWWTAKSLEFVLEKRKPGSDTYSVATLVSTASNTLVPKNKFDANTFISRLRYPTKFAGPDFVLPISSNTQSSNTSHSETNVPMMGGPGAQGTIRQNLHSSFEGYKEIRIA